MPAPFAAAPPPNPREAHPSANAPTCRLATRRCRRTRAPLHRSPESIPPGAAPPPPAGPTGPGWPPTTPGGQTGEEAAPGTQGPPGLVDLAAGDARLADRGPGVRVEPDRARRRRAGRRSTGKPARQDLPARRLRFPGGADQGRAEETRHRQRRRSAHRHDHDLVHPARREAGPDLAAARLVPGHPRERQEQAQRRVRVRRAEAARPHRRTEHRIAGRRLPGDRFRRLRQHHRRSRRDPNVPPGGDQGP